MLTLRGCEKGLEVLFNPVLDRLGQQAEHPRQLYLKVDDTILDDCRTQGLTPDKTHWARRIETAPFLAYPVRPGITFTYLATRVNNEARMLMKDGKLSANLFAAGEMMAGNVLGRGYAAGMGMTIGSVFGRIAGTEAARNARN